MSAARIPRLIHAWRQAAGHRPFTIVMYHSVRQPSDEFTVNPRVLRAQLQFIRDRYRVAKLSDATSWLVSEEPEKRVVLTFDDAFEDFYENAYPALQDLALPCTVFVPTGYIGKSSGWNEGTGIASRRIMSSGQLRELAGSALIDFGSHSVDHLNMRRLSSSQMQRQAIESKCALEDVLRRPIISFAYPYGTLDHFSSATRATLRIAGYKIAVTSRWGTMNRAFDLLALKRISFKDLDGSSELRAKLEGEYDWFAIKECVAFLAHRIAALRT